MNEEEVIKRIMPHSQDAEESVIGAMFLDAEAIKIASEMLTEGDFYNRAYAALFSAMSVLSEAGVPTDAVTVLNKLQEMSAPPEAANQALIREILTHVPTSANIRHYAKIVRDKSIQRKLIRECEEIENSAFAGTETVDGMLEDAEKRIFEVVKERTSSDYTPIKQIALDTMAMIEKAAKSGGRITGISTGFADLDFKTAGLQPSDFILIAARPSMGKTAFALNIAAHAALSDNVPVVIFSLEMSKEQLTRRLFSMEAKVDASKLRTGDLQDNEWEDLIEGADRVARSPLIIDDSSGLTIGEVRSKCRKYKMEHNIGLVMIDYLQLMTGDSGKNENRQNEVAAISRSLKAMARELNVPVVALAQLSREVEKRDDKHPMLSDLRESGSIEQDADVVMFIYREEYYQRDTGRKNLAEIMIAKQRNGPTGSIELTWIPQHTRFVDHIKQKDIKKQQ